MSTYTFHIRFVIAACQSNKNPNLGKGALMFDFPWPVKKYSKIITLTVPCSYPYVIPQISYVYFPSLYTTNAMRIFVAIHTPVTHLSRHHVNQPSISKYPLPRTVWATPHSVGTWLTWRSRRGVRGGEALTPPLPPAAGSGAAPAGKRNASASSPAHPRPSRYLRSIRDKSNHSSRKRPHIVNGAARRFDVRLDSPAWP